MQKLKLNLMGTARQQFAKKAARRFTTSIRIATMIWKIRTLLAILHIVQIFSCLCWYFNKCNKYLVLIEIFYNFLSLLKYSSDEIGLVLFSFHEICRSVSSIKFNRWSSIYNKIKRLFWIFLWHKKIYALIF